MATAHLWAHELVWREPETVFAVWGDAPWCAFLDSGGGVEERSRWQIFCRAPMQTLVVQAGQMVQNAEASVAFTPEALFDRLRFFLPADCRAAEGVDGLTLPFFGGWVGFAGYGLGQSLEQGMASARGGDEPDFAAGFYNHAFIWDRFSKRVFVAGLTYGGRKPAMQRRTRCMRPHGPPCLLFCPLCLKCPQYSFLPINPAPPIAGR